MWAAALAATPADLAQQSGPGLTGAVITALDQAEGVLWIGTDGGGLCRFDGEAVTCRTDLPSSRITAVRGDSAGAWVGTDAGLVRLDEDGAHTIDTDPVLGLEHHGGALWVATAGGLRYGDEQGFTQVSSARCPSLWSDGEQLVAGCSTGFLRWPEGTDLPQWTPAERIHGRAPADDPGGSWLAGGTDGLVAARGNQHVTRWLGPGPVLDVARAANQLALAVGEAGLCWWTPDDVRCLGRAEGLAGAVRVLEPGPGDGLWVGTDQGVALVDPGGQVTPLPLAPLAAGSPVWSVAPTKRGTAVLDARGLHWLGRRAPRGFEALQAAVGPHGLQLARRDRELWALTDRALLRLDGKGRLHRLELTAPGRWLTAVGEAMAVATDQGLQWWLPGATALGSPWRLPDIEGLIGAGGQGAWVAVAGGVALWTPAGEAHHQDAPNTGVLVPHRGGVVLGTEAGLAWMEPTAREPDPIIGTEGWGRIDAVTASAGVLWAANDRGEIWRFGEAAPVATVTGQVLELVVGEALWVATDRGVYRIE